MYLNALYRRAYHLDFAEDREYLSLVEDLLKEPMVQNMKNFQQHSDITLLNHVITVSFLSYTISKRLGWNHIACARAGLLHDLVTYDWHVKEKSHRFHGYRHPGFAAENAKTITDLIPLEEHIIRRHMWPLTPLPPKHKEAWLITFVDKFCATKETLRKYQRNPEVF